MSQKRTNTAFNTLDAILARQTQNFLSDFHGPNGTAENMQNVMQSEQNGNRGVQRQFGMTMEDKHSGHGVTRKTFDTQTEQSTKKTLQFEQQSESEECSSEDDIKSLKGGSKERIDIQERETSGPRAAERDNEIIEVENGGDPKKLYVKWYVRNERTGRPN